MRSRAMQQGGIHYGSFMPARGHTVRCDCRHRPGVLEHGIMKSYNDRCDQRSSSLFAQRRADVDSDPGNRMRIARCQPYARRARVLPSHGGAMRSGCDACYAFVLPDQESSFGRPAASQRCGSDATFGHRGGGGACSSCTSCGRPVADRRLLAFAASRPRFLLHFRP